MGKGLTQTHNDSVVMSFDSMKGQTGICNEEMLMNANEIFQ